MSKTFDVIFAIVNHTTKHGLSDDSMVNLAEDVFEAMGYDMDEGEIRELATNTRAQLLAYLKREQERKGRCICAAILSGDLDAVANPDCPVHGAMHNR